VESVNVNKAFAGVIGLIALGIVFLHADAFNSLTKAIGNTVPVITALQGRP
jgi:hypothetical protein